MFIIPFTIIYYVSYQMDFLKIIQIHIIIQSVYKDFLMGCFFYS